MSLPWKNLGILLNQDSPAPIINQDQPVQGNASSRKPIVVWERVWNKEEVVACITRLLPK
jgi:hypothetical protein